MPVQPGLDQPPGPTERRHLTFMFCDVVGSTRMSEQRDVEATFAVLNAYHDACRTVVERHGGVIAQYLGDGIYAWFGYPRPTDDDAVRAVRAGLDLLVTLRTLSARLEQELRAPLDARIGIHAGEALVAPIESTATLTAYGYTPNLAAKLQQVARPGTVVVSKAVLRLLKDDFEVLPRSPVRISGGADMPAFEVVAARRREGRVGRGGRTPLVGREAERARLNQMWMSVQAGGGAAVALVGSRGIGKTRLATETLSSAVSGPATVLDCMCSHLHANSPYRPFRTLLGQAVGIDPAGLPAVSAGLLRSHLLDQLGMPAESVSLLGGVLGLDKDVVGPTPDLDPSLLAKLTTELLVQWVTRLAATPTVVLVDDVTDADPSSLAVLDLLAAAPPPRLLLVLTVRSDVAPPPLLGAAAVQTVEIHPLPAESCAALVDAVAGGALDDEARKQVLEQGDGIPLFLEELARVARDGAGSGLPITLTEHLQARLLAPHVDRDVAGVLAVASGDLDERVLADVLDTEPTMLRSRVDTLVASDLVVCSGGPARAYRFRHGLITDAAYSLLLRDHRTRLHGRLADALVARPPASGQVEWEVVGKHLERAQRPLDAFDAFFAGAATAGRTGAYTEALRGYQDALDVLDGVNDASRHRLEVRCRVARGGTAVAAGGFGSDDAAAEFDRCVELCRRLGPSPEHLSAITGMQSFYVTRGDPAVGRRVAAEVGTWVAAGHDEYRADQALLMLFVDFFEGNYLMAGEDTSLAVREFSAHPREPGAGTNWLLPYDPVAIAMMYHGVLHWIAGRPDEGRPTLELAAARAAEVEFPAGPFTLAYVRSYQCWVSAITGDHRTAAGFARQCRDIGRRHGFAFWESCGEIHLAISEHWLHRRADAVPSAQRHAAIWELIGGLAFLPYVLATVADIRVGMGEPDAAAGFDASAELAERTGLRFYEAERLRLQALTLPLREGVGLLRRAWQVANGQGAWLFELRATLELARRTGEPEWARRVGSLVAGRPSAPEYPEIDLARAILSEAR